MPGSDPCGLCIRFPGLPNSTELIKLLKFLQASVGLTALTGVQIEFRSQRAKLQAARLLRQKGVPFEMYGPQRK